jgi:pSer/pThr/pTyr-binding forkhead associated (FHA) protein
MTPAIVLLIVRIVLAVCLYAFLAAALVLLWRDLRTPGSGGSTGPAPGAHLTAMGERASVQALIPLVEINLLGRAADNTIRVDEVTVSSHHARIVFRSGQWILEDLGSRNGTRVNGIAVEGPMVITYGDSLQFGEVMFGLRAGGVPEAPPSAGSSTGV